MTNALSTLRLRVATVARPWDSDGKRVVPTLWRAWLRSKVSAIGRQPPGQAEVNS